MPEPWSCAFNQFRAARPQRLIFVGPGARLRAKVVRGKLTREISAGFKALNNPHQRAKLGQTFKVSAPQRYHALDNVGPNRKILVMTGERYPEFTLRFDLPIPQSLVWALRFAFTRPGDPPPKEPDYEDRSRKQARARQEGQPVPRERTWGGGPTEDERRYCAQRRQKVNRKKMKELRTKRWKDPAQRAAQAERMRALNEAKKEKRDADREHARPEHAGAAGAHGDRPGADSGPAPATADHVGTS